MRGEAKGGGGVPGQKCRQALGREHRAGSPERDRHLTPRKSTTRFGTTMQRCAHRTLTDIVYTGERGDIMLVWPAE
jgi:hypothetical protein